MRAGKPSSASRKNLRENNEPCLKFKKGMMLAPTFGRGSQLLQSIHDSLLQSHKKGTHFSEEEDERIQPSTVLFPTVKLR